MYGLPFALGYNTNGFAHHGLPEAARVLAALGYEGIALTPDYAHADPFRTGSRGWRDLRRMLDRLRLRRAIETGARYLLDPFRKHEPTLVSPTGWSRRMEFMERAIGIADAIGAECVSFWAGRLHPGVPRAAAFRWLVHGCARLSKFAARRKVVLAFEPEPGMFVETCAQWRRLRDAVGSPWLRLTIDVGHVHCSERIGIAEAIRANASDLANVHLDDALDRVHEHLPPGRGVVDFASAFSALRASGFAGIASLELSRDSHRAVEAARQAMACLKPMLRAAVSEGARGAGRVGRARTGRGRVRVAAGPSIPRRSRGRTRRARVEGSARRSGSTRRSA